MVKFERFIICIGLYAILYGLLHAHDGSHFGFRTSVDPLYFSVVTGSTVGYGDFRPMSSSAKLIVMSQILCVVGILFVG
jgi:hypothetical protein